MRDYQPLHHERVTGGVRHDHAESRQPDQQRQARGRRRVQGS